MDPTMLANAAAMTAVVTLLVSLLAPFVESMPAFADMPQNKPRHDAALRLLNVALNVAVVFAFAAATRGVTAADVLPLVLQALAQSAGAHFVFQVVTGAPSAAVAGSALSDPAPSSVPDFPPGASSIAALGLPDVPEAVPAA